MVSDEYGAQPAPPGVMAGSWQAMLLLGVLTLILGIIVSFHPTGSLNVLAVLLGVLMILSGIFHLIRVFDRANCTGSGSASPACYSSWSVWS
jgi:uncharacterized membrane protein HdeD (DUF308 family)